MSLKSWFGKKQLIDLASCFQALHHLRVQTSVLSKFLNNFTASMALAYYFRNLIWHFTSIVDPIDLALVSQYSTHHLVLSMKQCSNTFVLLHTSSRQCFAFMLVLGRKYNLYPQSCSGFGVALLSPRPWYEIHAASAAFRWHQKCKNAVSHALAAH